MTGDRISIFGYSRGAYIARALAGMLQRVGLVPADNIQQIPFAWGLYLRGMFLRVLHAGHSLNLHFFRR